MEPSGGSGTTRSAYGGIMEGDEEKDIPVSQYQENKLIQFDCVASYTISKELQTTFKRVRDNM